MTVFMIVVARALAISLISMAVTIATNVTFFTAVVFLIGVVLMLNTQQLVDLLIEEHYRKFPPE